MNNELLQKDSAVSEFYQIPAIKKRLESVDPVRGAFELAYYDTQRTLRGIAKNPNRKQIKQEIFGIISNWYKDIAKYFPSYSLRDFDGVFLMVCNSIIEVGDKFGHKIYFGQAQKIFNMFFKYMLLVDERLNCNINYFHIPLDNVILKGIVKRSEYSCEIRRYAKGCMPWSKMEKSDFYMAIQEDLRKMYECPIIFEFKVWNEWE